MNQILKILKNIFGFRIIIVFVLSCNSSYSQDIIQKKTYSIIDTSESKFNQAKEIYSWITSNIHYDVKAYLEGNVSNKSVFVTLKKKKGICYDYSILFHEMCSSVGIESYLVYGYSKGPELFKGGGFYRANHCWNALHIDSSWFLVDATWGSGYLVREPTWYEKFMSSVFGTPCVNKKLEFHSNPTDEYFNPNLEEFRQTHMPLDPKWQLTKNPYSMKSFESDTSNQTILLYDYKDRLNSTKSMSEPEQIYTEGLSGKKFNPKNDYNISLGYLIWANEYDYKAIPIDSSKIIFFKELLNNYVKSKEHITSYHNTIDSVFLLRLGSIKKIIRDGRGTRNNIKHFYSSDKKTYIKKQTALEKKYDSLLKRIARYEHQISSLEKINNLDLNKLKPLKTDSIFVEKNNGDLNKSIIKCNSSILEIDSLVKFCIYKIKEDSNMISTCIQAKELLLELIIDFKSTLASEENIPISHSWSNLFSSYKSFKEKFKYKTQILSMVQSIYSKIISDLSFMTTEYKNQTELINKYYQYTKDSTGTIAKFQNLKESLIESYNKAIVLTYTYQVLTEQLLYFNDSNYELNKQLQKPTKLNIRYFVKYEKMLLSNQSHEYKIEKSLIKDIETQSTKSIQAISHKIDKYLVKNK